MSLVHYAAFMPLTEFTALCLLATAMGFTPGPNTSLATAIAANRELNRHCASCRQCR